MIRPACALPKAPATHKTMPMAVRAENALTGYVLLDLFRLCADRRCVARALPKGTLWMAGQTHKNLQSAALGILSVTLSKDTLGDYFKFGHCRMSELPVEEFFGRLRSRSSTSQLTARAYWRSAGKEMMRHLKSAKKSNFSDHSEVPPVTAEEFYQISKRALSSAIKLVAWCNNITEEKLRSCYLESEGYRITARESDYVEIHPWEADEKDAWEDRFHPKHSSNDANCGQSGIQQECKDLLDQVRADAEECDDAAPGEAEDENNDQVKEDRECVFDSPCEHLPDAEKLREVFAALGEPSSPFRSEDATMQSTMDPAYGRTLSRTLALCSDHLTLDDDGGAIFDALWRLCMYLRHWKQGADKRWLKNPRAVRKAAKITHWYKFLGYRIRKNYQKHSTTQGWLMDVTDMNFLEVE